MVVNSKAREQMTGYTVFIYKTVIKYLSLSGSRCSNV